MIIFRILLFVTLTLFLSPGMRASTCESLFDSFFIQKKQIIPNYIEPFFSFQEKKQRPLTFSLDSEIPLRDLLNAARTSPEVMDFLRKSKEFKQTWHISHFVELSEQSEKQFRHFSITEGSKNKNMLTFLDLHPTFFALIVSKKIKSPRSRILNLMIKATQKIINYNGLGESLKAGKDFNDIEIRHINFDSSPRNFKRVVLKLKDIFPEASSHLHVGIPSYVGKDKLIEISRIIETHIILSMALHRNSYTIYKHSSLTPKPSSGSRGVVLFKEKEWHSEDGRTHNLEIRMYSSQSHGLSLVNLAGVLAANHKDLKPTRGIENSVHDNITVNLHGALKYAHNMLKGQSSPAITKKTQEIERIITKIEQTNQITKKHREEVKKILTDNLILNILSKPSLYLKSIEN